MNLLKTILFSTLVFYMNSAQAQEEKHPRESISFAQGFTGAKSTVLVTSEKEYKLGNYSSIIDLLYSPSVSAQFVGSILCNQLVNESKIVLTSNQFNRITEIRNSAALLTFYSGCTCQELISLKEYFSGANPCSFRDSLNYWLNTLNEKE